MRQVPTSSWQALLYLAATSSRTCASCRKKFLHTAKRQNKIQKDRKKRQGNVRTCIISGGMIEPDFAFPYLQKQQFDIILAADRGLEFCYHYQIIPTYILGDFDSLSPEILNYYKENHVAPIREFNPMKDNTDTDIAFQQAIVLGSSEITILGATGGRLDHFLSIVQNLKTAWEKKIPAYIVDSRNLITIPVETSFEIRKEEQFGKYVSFFPLEKEVASITLEGFAYPLDHHYLPNTSGGLCVSNEIVEETAHVSYEGGILLMVQSRD
nr:thiamine diphosphokinase [Fusicatenibacter saccharivorans]